MSVSIRSVLMKLELCLGFFSIRKSSGKGGRGSGGAAGEASSTDVFVNNGANVTHRRIRGSRRNNNNNATIGMIRGESVVVEEQGTNSYDGIVKTLETILIMKMMVMKMMLMTVMKMMLMMMMILKNDGGEEIWVLKK